jgi:hypothetical protein
MLGKKLPTYTEVYSKVTKMGMEIVTSGKTYKKIGDGYIGKRKFTTLREPL